MICVDASVAAKWIFPDEPFAYEAEALYQDTVEAGEQVVAPALLSLEMTNVIRQRMRRAKPPGMPLLSPRDGEEALELFLALPITLHLPPRFHQQALKLAVSHDLAATYDAHYVTLAQLLGCPFWTADKRLVEHLADHLPFVKWIGEYRDGGRV